MSTHIYLQFCVGLGNVQYMFDFSIYLLKYFCERAPALNTQSQDFNAQLHVLQINLMLHIYFLFSLRSFSSCSQVIKALQYSGSVMGISFHNLLVGERA